MALESVSKDSTRNPGHPCCASFLKRHRVESIHVRQGDEYEIRQCYSVPQDGTKFKYRLC